MAAHPEDHLAEQFDGLSALDKIEWMIEANGWALEPIAADLDADPIVPGYSYTIGLPAAVDFPEVVIFGLAPAAANGLLTLVADARRGGTEIPLDVELVGLLDNELRCRFAPVDLVEWGSLFATATAWYRGAPYDVVQLLFPDRNGFMPYETGYETRMRFAQPVVGSIG